MKDEDRRIYIKENIERLLKVRKERAAKGGPKLPLEREVFAPYTHKK